MLNTGSLLGFIIAALIILLIPGPGVMYVVARSAAQGYRAGLMSAIGLSAGALVHVAAAAAGLSTILLASATAFNVVKIVGAGYLIYLGLRTLFSKQTVQAVNVTSTLSHDRLFVDGVIISVFNPKIAIFFLAFLPQFVDPALGSATRQIFLLGFIYAGLAMLTDGLYALMAGSLRRWFRGDAMQGPLLRYLSGGLYIGLGVNTALTGRSS